MNTISGWVTDTVTILPMDARSANSSGIMAIMKSIIRSIASFAYPMAILKLLTAMTSTTI
ncbi:hypothetical protein D3C80_2242270 [compost metagenome]